MPKKITEDQIESYMQTLIDTPGRLAALTEGMTEEQLSAAPAPGEWSLAEILAHLRGCADVWGYSIYAMFILDNPELADIHARTWAQKMGYAKLTFAENFTAFQVGRENLARILAGLSFEQWGRTISFLRQSEYPYDFQPNHADGAARTRSSATDRDNAVIR